MANNCYRHDLFFWCFSLLIYGSIGIFPTYDGRDFNNRERSMIEAQEVTKSYGLVEALKGLTFRIEPGEIVGLLGPNGAGKTTLLKILTTFFEPTTGQVSIDGHDVITEPLDVRKQVGYLPENAPLYQEMLVQESLLMTAQLRAIPPQDTMKLIGRAVHDTGLEKVITRPISQLSKGYRQRVGLAQAILHRPPILILDEPTSGLDPEQIVEVRNLVKRLAEKSTVILSTHILSEVEHTCERVLIIMNGQLKADAKLSDLTSVNRFLLGLSKTADSDLVSAALRDEKGVIGVKKASGTDGLDYLSIEAEKDIDLGERIFILAKQNDWPLRELKRDSKTLESVFHALSSGEEVAL